MISCWGSTTSSSMSPMSDLIVWNPMLWHHILFLTAASQHSTVYQTHETNQWISSLVSSRTCISAKRRTKGTSAAFLTANAETFCLSKGMELVIVMTCSAYLSINLTHTWDIFKTTWVLKSSLEHQTMNSQKRPTKIRELLPKPPRGTSTSHSCLHHQLSIENGGVMDQDIHLYQRLRRPGVLA